MFYLYFIPGVIFSFCFLHTVTFFSTLMSLKDRLRLKLKVITEISLCMAIMLDHPGYPYIHSTTVLCDIHITLCKDTTIVTSIVCFQHFHYVEYIQPCQNGNLGCVLRHNTMYCYVRCCHCADGNAFPHFSPAKFVCFYYMST